MASRYLKSNTTASCDIHCMHTGTKAQNMAGQSVATKYTIDYNRPQLTNCWRRKSWSKSSKWMDTQTDYKRKWRNMKLKRSWWATKPRRTFGVVRRGGSARRTHRAPIWTDQVPCMPCRATQDPVYPHLLTPEKNQSGTREGARIWTQPTSLTVIRRWPTCGWQINSWPIPEYAISVTLTLNDSRKP